MGVERTILLVSDERQLGSILSRVPTRADHDIRTASDGADARPQLAREMPDLVVLDINRPDESGWSVLRWLRTTMDVRTCVVVTATNVCRESAGAR